jgi:hypothetical protein
MAGWLQVGPQSVTRVAASRPAWALNCTLSGQMSGNMSGVTDAETCGGEGCSPGYWMNHSDRWCPDYAPTMFFNSVFGSVFVSYSPTLYEVICDQCVPYKLATYVNANCSAYSSPNALANYQNAVMQLAFHSIAALQNACTAVSFDLTVDEVIKTFQSAYNSGDCNKSNITMVKDQLDILNNQGSPLCSGSNAIPCKSQGKTK